MNPGSLAAPAKVNLQLAVTGRRGDGQHLLDSLVVFAALADRVTLVPAGETSLQVTGPFKGALAGSDPGGTSVGKAIGAFLRETGLAESYAVTIEKNIPVAAGIGGGSSDAAAALILLNRQHGMPLDEAGLDRVGLMVGADVPVCLRAFGNGAADGVGWRMRDTGGELDRVTVPEGLGLILVNGGDAVSTAQVFEALDAAADTPARAQDGLGDLPESCGFDTLERRMVLGNDLLDAAMRVCPGIAGTLERVRRISGSEGFVASGMSGSGATCFALFTTRAAAEAAAEAAAGLARGGVGWCWAGGLYRGNGKKRS